MSKFSRKTKVILFHIGIVLVVVAVILFCRNFRYYSAETVRQIHDEYSLHLTYDSSGAALPPKPIITHLHSSDFKKCTLGMTHEEMIDLFGVPHASYGSGFYYEVYFTTDGCLIFIRCNDSVEHIGATKML